MKVNEIIEPFEESIKKAEEDGRVAFQCLMQLDVAQEIVEALRFMQTHKIAGEKKTCESTFKYNSPYADTVAGMISPDYKERFKAEYHQTKIRYEKLKRFNNTIEAAERAMFIKGKVIEPPKHDCPSDILREQQRVMEQYLHVLEVRAVIEGIEL